ncbi:methionine adenosyltransferase [Lentibacter sp. XHP0401]|uniref:methionine adenosyltransferase n=1 Tax=Lentibacter sp. XHP0401 TaxID=2984334 RepID=UPI0021E7FFAB|nr:methionine adenosyltransferase [Lentibacter sp. XHP0401]MCV2893722.1 methionine adenosyltransferase [Lentibacter sp. XHP0401]
MQNKTGLFTSESVSHGHPDKICDQISDAILDACLSEDPSSRVAVEVAIKSNFLCILGEISTHAIINPTAIARQVLRDIGHTSGLWGVDVDQIKIVEELSKQSCEIGARVDDLDTGAGDQGLMFGYACNETPTLMPLPVTLAHAIMERHWQLRQMQTWAHLLGPDAKAQVTVRYANGQPEGVAAVVLSSQHSLDVKLEDLRVLLMEEVVKPVLGPYFQQEVILHINPAGTFISGGPVADAGLTGRKIIVDTYGGMARHGGGAFSGKDATKVDRSAAYAARQMARDVVARGWAEACEVRAAYAIGQAHPVAVDFETFGTGCGASPLDRYRELEIDVSDALRPASIIERLQLRTPIFRQTAALGHFGRRGFPWEAALTLNPALNTMTETAIS